MSPKAPGIQFCTLASSSAGNVTFFRNPQGCILVDAGLSGKKLGEHLDTIGVPYHSIAGILLTHAHSDHIRGAGIAARKFGLPLFMTRGTGASVVEQLTGKERCITLIEGKPLHLAGFTITPIPTPHDAPGAVCFILEHGGVRVGLFTDMGHCFEQAKTLLPTLDGIILESNHDPKMLHACARPPSTKARIAGARGHLSNEDAAELIRDHASERLRVILLAHLSGENNHPELALQKHASIAADFHASRKPLIEVAPGHTPSRMYALHPLTNSGAQ